MTKIILIVTSVLLAGCAAITKQRLTDEYSSFIGRPISEAIIQFGPPASQVDVGPDERAFQWDKRGLYQSPATASRVYGTVFVNPSQAMATRCLVTFVAKGQTRDADMSHWIINRWQFNASDMNVCN